MESFARNLMVSVDVWQESGFGAVAKTYIERLPRESGLRRTIDDNGDLLIAACSARPDAERLPFLPRLATPAWLDPQTRRRGL